MEKFSGSMSKTIDDFMETYNKNFNIRCQEIEEFEDVFKKSCEFIISNKFQDKLDYKKSVRFESIFGAIMKAIKEKKNPMDNFTKIFEEFIDPKKKTDFANHCSAGGTGGMVSIKKRIGYVYEKLFLM